MDAVAEEISFKLSLLRTCLQEFPGSAIRLKSVDWFAWASAGASNAVLLTTSVGVAEILVTAKGVWVLTDEIEAARLRQEELHSSFEMVAIPWAKPQEREIFVKDIVGEGKIFTDFSSNSGEELLPQSLHVHRQVLLPSELERYRWVGRLASEAMSEVMRNAKPHWTEFQLAGAGAEALWSRGLHPALILCAGERRLPLYRHPIPTGEPLGRRAMLVFCARASGLYANLTRFVTFGNSNPEHLAKHKLVRDAEAIILNNTHSGQTLAHMYNVIKNAYAEREFQSAIDEHHQGGTTGYMAREVVAAPHTLQTLEVGMAVAWNPSVVGAKIEDTFVLGPDHTLENLTYDPHWPAFQVDNRFRPVPLEGA
jgi:hypothetical protein